MAPTGTNQSWQSIMHCTWADGGRSFQYVPQIEPSRQLQRKIEDAVLAAFEDWKQSQSTSEVR
jgi:hypothetical protein